jgi:uracil-DNA glycosylase family 4
VPTANLPNIYVPPSGPTPAAVMIVGEAPGIEEIKKKEPFVGKSGIEGFTQLSSYASLSREDVRTTNVFKYPLQKPEKKITEDEWLDARKELRREISDCSPKVILAFGGIAVRALLPETRRYSMETLNAMPHWFRGLIGAPIIIPSFHPAAAFRDSSRLEYIIRSCRAVRDALQNRLQPLPAPAGTTLTPLGYQLSFNTIALDTETTRDGSGLIVGVSGAEETAALVWKWEASRLKEIAERVASPDVLTLLHNALFDLPVLWKMGICPARWVDTMSVAFFIQCLPLGLKELAYRLCGMRMREYEEVVGNAADLSRVRDRGAVMEYAMADPHATLRVYNRMLPMWYPGMADNLQRDADIQPMVISMMQRGIKADKQFFINLDIELEAKNVVRALDIAKFAAAKGIDKFNPRSAPQLRDLLYAKMNLNKGVEIAKTSITGKLSTGKKYLARMRDKDPIVRMIDDYKETATLRSNFVGRLPKTIAKDGRIHTTLSMVRVLHSGRFASKDPNLLGIPVRSDDGRRIREGFVAAPGFTFVSGDASQIEMRVMAHISQDPTMLKIFREDGDIHAETVTRIFGIKRKEDMDDYKHRLPAKCFHPDTEVLTKTGWKKIIEIKTGEEIAQATPGNNGEVLLSWVVPNEVFTAYHPSQQLVHLSNKGIDIRVTPDHRMLGWRVNGSIIVTTPDKIDTSARYWANAGIIPDNKDSKTVNENTLRLAVALQADGSITPWGGIRWGFSRKRKADRLRELLLKEDIPFNESIHSNGKNGKSKAFSINNKDSKHIIDLLDKDKTFPWWWIQLSYSLRKVVIDEILYWDGSKNYNRIVFSSWIDKNINVIQAIASVTGSKTRWMNRQLSIADHCLTRTGNTSIEVNDYVREVACLSVPSSFVLVRDRGVTLICGQTVGFGILNLISAMGLSRELIQIAGPSWTVERCQQLLDAWFKAYPYVRRHLDNIAMIAKRYGYVQDMWGRRELIPQMQSAFPRTREEGIRIAANQQIQAGAQGIFKEAMRNIWQRHMKRWVEEGWCWPLLQVHDDLIVECKEDMADYVATIMKYEMENCAPQMTVPVKVEMKKGPVWATMQKMKEVA